jgi:hypothetical protein
MRSKFLIGKLKERGHLEDIVVDGVILKDPESYAGGRGSHAGQVKGDDPDKKGYPGPPGWGLGVGLTTPPCKILICFETSTEASESGGRRLGRPWSENEQKGQKEEGEEEGGGGEEEEAFSNSDYVASIESIVSE